VGRRLGEVVPSLSVPANFGAEIDTSHEHPEFSCLISGLFNLSPFSARLFNTLEAI
jgi:hypothetical protein